MTCFHPLSGWREPFPGKSGKFRIVGLKARTSKLPVPPGCCAVEVPCGRCSGCRLDRSRKWAIRCLHEASLYERNCFVTLTYSKQHLPEFGRLVRRDLQNFLKRLRKKYGSGIRFYACGEYGSEQDDDLIASGQVLGRPHYHICIFNHDFNDRVLFKVRNGVNLYVSDSLSKLWDFGFSTVGDVTFESAAYVARYVMKKITGDLVEHHYTRLVPETGELVSIPPEYTVMSRRPGIGKPWLDKFMTDVYPDDFVVIRGKKMKPPRYYDLQFELARSDLFQVLKTNRLESLSKSASDCTLDRLSVREQCSNHSLSNLRRSLV